MAFSILGVNGALYGAVWSVVVVRDCGARLGRHSRLEGKVRPSAAVAGGGGKGAPAASKAKSKARAAPACSLQSLISLPMAHFSDNASAGCVDYCVPVYTYASPSVGTRPSIYHPPLRGLDTHQTAATG